MSVVLSKKPSPKKDTSILFADVVLPPFEKIRQQLNGIGIPLVTKFPSLTADIHLPGALQKIKLEFVAIISLLGLIGANAYNLSRCQFSESANIEANFSQVYKEQATRIQEVAFYDEMIDKAVKKGNSTVIFDLVKERAEVASQYNIISEVSRFSFSRKEYLPRGESAVLPREISIPGYDEVRMIIDNTKRVRPNP